MSYCHTQGRSGSQSAAADSKNLGAFCADLLNVFETFLPQLLLYPNPTDPLNGEAAALLMREPQAYNQKVKGTLLMPSNF